MSSQLYQHKDQSVSQAAAWRPRVRPLFIPHTPTEHLWGHEAEPLMSDTAFGEEGART